MAGSGVAHLRERSDLVLRVEHLLVTFPAANGAKIQAVSDVSFDVARGETLGLVGESGCGKSTTGRAILQLPRPSAGVVSFDGVDLTTLTGQRLRRNRTRLQMIFQDPIASLNPRRKVRQIVAEGLQIWRKGNEAAQRQQIDEVLEAVGLDPAAVGDRRPHELSGGQCQRVCIARSVVLDPAMLICDEPVSALDVSVQAQILNLLEEMKKRFDLTMIFIAHDLAVVKNISDRVAVMYLGKMCEISSAETLYRQPAHPYSRALLASIPQPDPTLPPSTFTLEGELPSAADPPSGCRFRTRCPRAAARCAEEEPVIREVSPSQFVACHFPHVGAEAPAMASASGHGQS